VTRPLLLRVLLLPLVLAVPAHAEGTPKLDLLAPPVVSCEAPALPASAPSNVRDEAAPPPFRQALLTCTGDGPPKLPIRRT